MFLMNLGLNCFIALVGKLSLLGSVILSVRCLVAVLMSRELSLFKSVSSASVLFWRQKFGSTYKKDLSSFSP